MSPLLVLPSSVGTESAYPIGIFEARYPAHRCRYLRFTGRLTATRAKLAVRMESLSPFLQDSLIPYFMPVYPGAPQLCTGPRTAEGKARSARNACKHGLTATHLVIRDDEREEFQFFLDNLTTEIQPEGELETITFDHLVHAAWTLRRCRRAETELAASGPDPFLDDTAGKTQDRIVRYAGKAERSYYKALKELRTLQTHRALREQCCMQDSPIDPETGEQNEAIPALASVEKVRQIGWEAPNPGRQEREMLLEKARRDTEDLINRTMDEYIAGRPKVVEIK